ncbi:hypothetical protein EV129_11541 [Rhizobium azibense]|uniref:Uncharacterized protein n=1 Tax=Rhizobium azibense TaxID=1136135 RepID=A0A4R3RPR3_9HYPH|nr:hypothetical protein EV129_11541 [Rhizobium azibense]
MDQTNHVRLTTSELTLQFSREQQNMALQGRMGLAAAPNGANIR